MRKYINKILSYGIHGLSSSGIKRYSQNTGWIFFQKAISFITAFLVGVYIARYLGPANYGVMSYAVSFVGVFAAISNFGIDEIVKRELVKHPEKKQYIINTGFWIKLCGGVVTVICISLITVIFHIDHPTKIFIFIYSLTFIFQSANIFDIFFYSQVQSKLSVRVQVYTGIVTAFLKLAAIYLHLGVIWFIWILLSESIFLAFGFWASYFYFYSSQPLHISFWDKKLAYEIIKASWPLMLSGVAITTYMRIDQVIIGNILGVASVGIYAVAVKLSEVWYIIPTVVCSSLFPAVVHARMRDPLLYKNRLGKLYFLMFWIAVCIAVPISLFAHPIVVLLFGTAYLGAVHVLQIYIWAGIAVFIGTSLAQYLTIENQTKIYFMITVCGGISNILLNIILIPRFGITGSAVATVVSYSLVILSIVLFKQTRHHGFFIIRSIFPRNFT